ncbi:MAG TPA: hypothetical protein VK638_43945 [Edaphobacter sp.]|nr:hypothetical protein [Edaphobacter sp.]
MDRRILNRNDRPHDLNSLKHSIASREIVLSDALMKIGRFVLTHPDTVAFASGRELAGIVGASPSSVSRLANALGFQGHADLRKFFQNHVREWAKRRPIDRNAFGACNQTTSIWSVTHV